MRKRKLLEQDGTKFVNRSMLILEVLLDIRDILEKATKVKGKHKKEDV